MIRFVAAVLVGMIVTAVSGGVLYGVVFSDFIAANLESASGVMKPAELGWVALAHVPFGLLLALVVRWRGVLTARGGAVSGATLGLLMAAGYDLSQYATTNLWSLKLTLIDPLISMLMIAISGAAVGAVLGFRHDGARRL